MTIELCCKTCAKSRIHRGEVLMCHKGGDVSAKVCREACDDYEREPVLVDAGKVDSAEGWE